MIEVTVTISKMGVEILFLINMDIGHCLNFDMNNCLRLSTYLLAILLLKFSDKNIKGSS